MYAWPRKAADGLVPKLFRVIECNIRLYRVNGKENNGNYYNGVILGYSVGNVVIFLV